MWFNAYDEKYLPTHILRSFDPNRLLSQKALLEKLEANQPNFPHTSILTQLGIGGIRFSIGKSVLSYDPNLLDNKIVDW